ncbi:hypothetical protein ILUMI_23188 [Ignelater luminosus]|uniref:Uncharacterized protein n=1 Tax=Ignelater luminosus TaxID=2038154 RepID=A0A8K0FX13_IGNLU|nr:hypothetical protein ILUMI_23188 [Ignelater luminosus]
MEGNENMNPPATIFNISDEIKSLYNDSYLAFWNPKDPGMRYFNVNPDFLEVRSQYWEHVTIVPILATVMLAVTVLLLVLFRQSPAMVAGTVAACLAMIGIYLILSTLNEKQIKFE